MQLTAEEVLLVDYAAALAGWLEPYHDYTRPPPAVVLAEAARQTELKTGHPLKGVDLQSLNGNTNGNGKKDEDPPAVTEPPELVLKFFEREPDTYLLWDDIHIIFSRAKITILRDARQLITG